MESVQRSPVETDYSWQPLQPGTAVEIAKLHTDGHESTRYPGRVLDQVGDPEWIAIAAEWTRDPVHLDGLRFEPGDHLREYFSPSHWFNVFEVIAPDGVTRGWYANVTYPAWMDVTEGRTTVFWHDLIVDLIVLPDGSMTIRDEDELEEAHLPPGLCQQISTSRNELIARAKSKTFPFDRKTS